MKTKKELTEEMTKFIDQLGPYETDLLFLDLNDLTKLYPHLTKEDLKAEWLDLRLHLREHFKRHRGSNLR